MSFEYFPISYTLVGNGGDYASRPFERKGGTVAQPSAGVSGTQLPAVQMVDRSVGPPAADKMAGDGSVKPIRKKPGRTTFANIVLERG